MAALAKKILMASSMAVISIAIAIGALYFFIEGVKNQHQSIVSNDAIIVLRLMHSYLPGAIIGAMGVLLFAVALLTLLHKETLYKKMLPYCSWICIISIVTIFAGGLGISYYWHQFAQGHGYVKCGITDRVSTTKVHTSYWAKSDTYCESPIVARILQHPSEARLKKANNHLMSLNK